MRSRCRLAGAFVVVWTVSLCIAGMASALPAGREYEMVSPVFKGGFGAPAIQAVAPAGEAVAFYSPGAFAGAPGGVNLIDYLARRGSSGWSTAPVMPPASLMANVEAKDVSPSLGMVFAMGKPGASSESALRVEDLLLHPTGLPDDASGWEQVGGLEPVVQKTGLSVQQKGSDPSFCHVLLASTTDILLPEAENTLGQLYELDSGCGGGQGSLKLVGMNNQGKLLNPGCGVDVGVEDYAFNGVNTFGAVSADGGEVFFTDCLSGSTSSTSPHQLFVRLAGSRTVEISKPFVLPETCSEVPCAGVLERGSAEFAGASEDGSRVFFSAPLAAGQPPLVSGTTDASNNLYTATIGCPQSRPECSATEREVTSLTEVSRNPNGGAADVRGVLRVAPDGQRAYFVAGGDLLIPTQQQALEGEGRPVPHAGADNLYMYDGTTSPGTIAFVGDLCSGKELSGSTEDIRCPSTTGTDTLLWSSDRSEAQTAGPDGRFLVFSTYAQLGADDANAARDVYRYDAQTGALERVSVGEGGYKANGNGGLLGSKILPGNHGVGEEGAPVRSQYEMNSRAISEDGSRIVFVSPEPLSPLASNGLANVYEWDEAAGGSGGSVSLVSSGSGEEPVEDVVISPDGSSVVFDTVEGLVPQDTDGLPDVYDARLGGGFPSAAAERRPCEGDACQGPLTNPAPLLVPGSVSQAPGESVRPAKKTVIKKKTKRKCRRGYGRNRRGNCVKIKKRPGKAATAHRRSRRSSGGGEL